MPMCAHLPDRVPLFGKKLEVLVCELHGGQRVQFQVRPRAKEGGQVDEGVETQSIVAVVGQVSHEYTDLLWRNREGEIHREFMNICSTYWVILIKSKSHFPSSHVYKKKWRQSSKYNYCCCDCRGKQTDYFVIV